MSHGTLRRRRVTIRMGLGYEHLCLTNGDPRAINTMQHIFRCQSRCYGPQRSTISYPPVQ